MSERPHQIHREGLALKGEWLSTWRFAGFLGFLIFLAFPQVITGFHSFVFRDYGLFGYPLAHYYRQSFWRGELPLWNPYNNCGLPFLAQWNTMVLYPPSLFYLLLPLPWSLSMFTLLHQFFGGLGMYVLASKWTGNRLAGAVAGIAFSFNGFTLNCLMWPNHIASISWAPWVILVTTRAWREGGKRIWQAALVGALQMLSGTPEIILFTWSVLGVLFVCEPFMTGKNLWIFVWRAGAVVLLVSALSAAQLLPFFELLAHSERTPHYEAGHWPIPVWGWANLFVPLFRTFPTGAGVYFQSGQLLTSSYYPGLFTMLLAVFAMCWRRERQIWIPGIFVMITFVIGMGEHTQLYSWLHKVFPPLGMMRYLVKFVIVLAILLPLLAASGFAAFAGAQQSSGPERRTMRSVVALAATVIAVTVGIIIYARVIPYRDDNWSLMFENGFMRVIFLLAILGVIWMAGRSMKMMHARLLEAFLLMLLCVDLMKHMPQQNPTVPAETLTAATPFLDQLNPRPQVGVSRALLSPNAHTAFAHAATSNLMQAYLYLRAGLYNNVNLIDDIPKVDGFFALYLQSERDIYARIHQPDGVLRSGLGRFLGVSQATSASNVLVWCAQTNYMPLISAGQAPIFTDRSTTLTALMARDFAPEKTVYLPTSARREVAVTNGDTRIVSSRIAAHRIEAQVHASHPSIVVVAQAYYPRWKAFLDAQPVKLWRANHAFQAMQVPSGIHRLTLVYDDRPFFAGAFISLAALLGITFTALFSRIYARRALIRDSQLRQASAATIIGLGTSGAKT